MATNKTTFRQLALGAKFRRPGSTVTLVKTSAREAEYVGSGANDVMLPRDPVVPEQDATVDDILGSWRAL